MAHYLKLPDDKGSSAANNWLVQVTGISGVMANVEFKLALPTVPYTRRRYYYDGARTPNSNASSTLNSNLSQQFSGSYGIATISNLRINGDPAVNTAAMFNNRVAEDVLSFDCSVAASEGCAAFFAQGNATNAMYSIGIYYLKITDDNCVHTFNMSSSNGVLREFTSDTGQLTLKLFNFPVNNSHWVFYGDGNGETNDQILSATGTLSSVASGIAATQIINEQLLNTSGSVNTAASGSAATITINEQVLTATGQVSVIAVGAVQLLAVNEQQNAIAGSLQTQTAALAQLNSINEQNFTVTGSASAVMAGFAQVQAVNELAGEQIGFISGALHAYNTGVAAVQGINDQHINVAGTAVLSSAANALAIAVNEQHLNLTGSAQSSSYAFASLQGINEQAGEQIGNIGGQIIAASAGQAVVSAINDQHRSISGTIIGASSGRARLQKINQGNIVLAPDRMSARRITENLSATHIKHNITAYRV